MPLNGSGTASKPSGTAAVSGQTIESAKFNAVIDDIYSIFNTPRPVLYGGTGAANASGARTALGAQAQSSALDALSSAFTAASASGPAALDFAEDTDNGSNKVTLVAPASIASNRTLTMPDKDGTIATTDDVPEAMTLLGTLDMSSGSSWAVTDIPSHKHLLLIHEGVSHNNGAAQQLQYQLSTDNGSNYATAVSFSGDIAGASAYSGSTWIFGTGTTSRNKVVQSVYVDLYNAVAVNSTTTGVVNAIRLKWSAGSGDAGKTFVYAVN